MQPKEASLPSVVLTSKIPIPASLRLMRPANVVTACADILTGYAASGAANPTHLIELLAATIGLYGGGIVLNDVFDAPLDRIERPERPIPSGAIALRSAALFGIALLVCGIAAAFLCSPLSGIIACATAAAAVLYDAVGKRQHFLGPVNMGLCRGLNLLLGLTAAGELLASPALLAVVTLCYIAGVTALSRGEVRGGTRTAARISVAWLVLGSLVLAVMGIQNGRASLFAVPLLAVLLVRLAPPFWKAVHTLDPQRIRLAVKTGVLSLILLDAALAALFQRPWYGLYVLALYVPAMLLAKLFAVT